MKHLALIAVAALVTTVHTCGQSLEEITTIAFTKQSRGFLDEIVISRDSVRAFVENHRAPQETRHYATPVDQDEWTSLILSLKDVPLDDVDGLQSPTTNRAHDGALHSSIVITFSDGHTISHSFDDENPHPDLKPLLDAILHFRTHASR